MARRMGTDVFEFFGSRPAPKDKDDGIWAGAEELNDPVGKEFPALAEVRFWLAGADSQRRI